MRIIYFILTLWYMCFTAENIISKDYISAFLWFLLSLFCFVNFYCKKEEESIDNE